jgi:ABC-type Na+ efflux pump permease subunit
VNLGQVAIFPGVTNTLPWEVRMRMNNYYSPLFRLACRLLKYFLLALFTFALVCILSSVFGAFEIVSRLIWALGEWLVRVFLLILGVLAAAIVCESVRQ